MGEEEVGAIAAELKDLKMGEQPGIWWGRFVGRSSFQ